MYNKKFGMIIILTIKEFHNWKVFIITSSNGSNYKYFLMELRILPFKLNLRRCRHACLDVEIQLYIGQIIYEIWMIMKTYSLVLQTNYYTGIFGINYSKYSEDNNWCVNLQQISLST